MSVAEAFSVVYNLFVMYRDWYVLLGLVFSTILTSTSFVDVIIHDRKLVWYDEILFEIFEMWAFVIKFVVIFIAWPIFIFAHVFNRWVR